MLLRLSVLLIGAVIAMPASAGTKNPEAGAASVATEKPGAEDKIICRSKRETRTGSHMRPGKECRTESDWKEREIAAQRELQRLRDRAQTPGLALGRKE